MSNPDVLNLLYDNGFPSNHVGTGYGRNNLFINIMLFLCAPMDLV